MIGTPDVTTVVFSFNGHQQNLIPLLREISRYGPLSHELIIVWDDFVRTHPVDWQEIAYQSGCEFRVILQSDLYQWPSAIGEWGWIKQQFAKLLSFRYTATRYIWICDGDLELRAPVDLFAQDGRPFLMITDEPINPDLGYYDFITKGFGIEPHVNVIANGGGNCTFDARVLEDLWQTFESRHSMDMVQWLARDINPGGPHNNQHNAFPISEFETYGNFVFTNHRASVKITQPNWALNFVQAQKQAVPVVVRARVDR